MSVIHADNLVKSFDGTLALNQVTFKVEEAEIFGFIGPDGGGKSTLFRIITALLKADSGTIDVLGVDPGKGKEYYKLRPKLGYMPGRFSLYQDLSVRENLEFFASVFGTTVHENYKLIQPVFHQLEPFRDRLAGNLSGGMKQKLALSCALIHRPQLLVLDEPTTGVDAISRKEFWNMLHTIKNEGITVIVSTPYMQEAAQCSRIALIQGGNILKIDTPESIVSATEKNIWSVKADNTYRLIVLLRGSGFVSTAHPFGDSVHITLKDEEKIGVPYMENWLTENGFSGIRIEAVKPTIEDVFMSLMI